MGGFGRRRSFGRGEERKRRGIGRSGVVLWEMKGFRFVGRFFFLVLSVFSLHGILFNSEWVLPGPGKDRHFVQAS